MEILKAKVLRLSLVDDGAYPQSAIRLRVDPMAAGRIGPRLPIGHRRRLMVV